MHGSDLLFWGIVSGSFLSLLALLTALLTALFFLSTFADNLLLEDNIDGELVIFAEVARHGDLDHRGVILQIEQQAIEMDVDGASTEVVEDEVLLDLANAANSALEHFLDKDALLWVHNLIVTLLKLAIDLDILDVEDGVVAEPFLEAPKLTILDTMLIFVRGGMLHLDLLLQVVHCIT